MAAEVRLKAGREKSLLRKHPWVFSGSIGSVSGQPEKGETVALLDSKGRFLAWAGYSPNSQIRARVWSWDESEQISAEFFRRKIEASTRARSAVINPQTTSALRLVHGESDGIPGFVLDRYGDTLVTQFWTAGAERWREVLCDLSIEATGAKSLYERSDVEGRSLEGLEQRTGLLRGVEPPEWIEIIENGLRFLVDVRRGHKTGFYLDQRQNRAALSAYANGRAVLDCFCYTGGFSCFSLAGGAESVVAVDSSENVLAQARRHVDLNQLPAGNVTWVEGDVFQVLRKYRDEGRSFSLIILDPPKFAQTSAQVQRAARGYKDINLLAFKLLRPGGLLFTFSCSGGVSENLFQKIVAGAALDAGVDAQIVSRLSQGPDHPVALNFPEGAYLKGLVLRTG